MVFRYGKGASHPVTPRPKVEVAPITVELPWPHGLLSPNGRTRSWKYKAAIVKQHKELAIVTLHQACKNPPKWDKARFSVTAICGKGKKEGDPDNLVASLKTYLDAIQFVGIVKNDRQLRIEGDVVFKRDKGLSESKVIITVREDEDA